MRTNERATDTRTILRVWHKDGAREAAALLDTEMLTKGGVETYRAAVAELRGAALPHVVNGILNYSKHAPSKADRVRKYEAHTCGSEHLYTHGVIRSFQYTDGIKFLAEVCEAFWLIDAVASHQGNIRGGHPRHADFQVWRLMRGPVQSEDGTRPGWVLEAWSDTPGEPGSVLLARQEILYSDFPDELLPYEWWVEYGTMMMKAER